MDLSPEIPSSDDVRPSRRAVLRLSALAALALPFGLADGAAAATSKDRVLLFRGFMNVFSFGLDDMAGQLNRHGVSATVYNHMSGRSQADRLADLYRRGELRRVVLIGHSLGADAIGSMAQRLQQLGVPVALAVTLDPGVQLEATPNVRRFVNFYNSHGIGQPVSAGPGFKGALSNIDLATMPGIGHMNVDKAPRIQKMVLGDVYQALR